MAKRRELFVAFERPCYRFVAGKHGRSPGTGWALAKGLISFCCGSVLIGMWMPGGGDKSAAKAVRGGEVGSSVPSRPHSVTELAAEPEL